MIGPKDFQNLFPEMHFKNFPFISDLLSELSMVQRHTNVCSKFNTFIAVPYIYAHFAGKMSLLLLLIFLLEFCFCSDKPGFNLISNIQSTVLLDKHKI